MPLAPLAIHSLSPHAVRANPDNRRTKRRIGRSRVSSRPVGGCPSPHRTRSCQRSLRRSVPSCRSSPVDRSCRSSFLPIAGNLRQFNLCRRRLCETLRGKIPSVVKYRRRLRTHKVLPFVPGWACFGLPICPSRRTGRCRAHKHRRSHQQSRWWRAAGSNGGFVPEHRLSCAVIRVFDKPQAHSTRQHCATSSANERVSAPALPARALRGGQRLRLRQTRHASICSPSSRPASQGRLQTLRPPVRAVYAPQLARVIIAATCIQLFPWRAGFRRFQITVGVRTRRLAVCHRRVSYRMFPRRDALAPHLPSEVCGRFEQPLTVTKKSVCPAHQNRCGTAA